MIPLPPRSTLFPYTTLFRSDPQARRVRSWIFDAAGGFGEGAWTREGNRWVVKTTSVLQDGKRATATIVLGPGDAEDRKSTRLNSSHQIISYAVFCLKKKKEK